jgi:hypothetical protein
MSNPKFLTGSDGILLIRQEIIQGSVSNYWQQGERRHCCLRTSNSLRTVDGAIRFCRQPSRRRTAGGELRLGTFSMYMGALYAIK